MEQCSCARLVYMADELAESEDANTPSLHGLVEEQAARTPCAVAVTHAGRMLTYGELDHRANQVAHALRAHGVGSDVLVGVCLERSLDLVVGLLGVLKAGGAYVPLDPGYPPERLGFMMKDARVAVLLTKAAFVAKLPVPDQVPVLHLDASFWRSGANAAATTLTDATCPASLAYVIYTSGSTGLPKGVAVTHQGVLNLVQWHLKAFEVSEHDRATAIAALGFDASVWELWPYLAIGASVHLVDDQIRPSVEQLRDWFVEERITIAFLPTLLAERALRLEWPPNLPLRMLLTGGDKLHLHPPPLLPFALINNYGPTECSVITTSGVVPPQLGTLAEAPSLGHPISHVQVYVLNEEMASVEVGTPGELYVGGRGLARGYLHRPGLTAERFVPHPFSKVPGARLYRTGDRARWRPDGTLEFLGRLDDQVKLRGFRIELGEVEAAVRQHPDVCDAAVVVCEGERGKKRLVAYVVPSSVAAGNAREMRAALEATLPGYMVPSEFIGLDTLPLTAHGKLDRRALPMPQQPEGTRPEEEPNTPWEAVLAAIWREVLGLAHIGRHDNFFELGGDSIVGIQLLARARRAGLQLSTKEIFEHPTIAELAAHSTPVQAIQAEQGHITGDVPLVPIQHWYFVQELPAPHHFNQAFLLEVKSQLDLAVLERALTHLLWHHDALRLRFTHEATGWRQRHTTAGVDVPVEFVDLAPLPKERRLAELDAIVANRQASLDLTAGPLARAILFGRGEERGMYLLLVIHHLVVDGVSWRIILEDLETACRQLQQGLPVQLPAKTTSFQEWAKRLTDYARSSSELRREGEYWSSAASESIASLPRDFREGSNRGTSLRTTWVSLDSEETRVLLQDVPKAYRTQINDVLLTALVQAFAKWTGSRSLLLNLQGHGREPLFPDVDLSRTVGWFTSIFPILLDLGESTGSSDALKAIKEQLRCVPQRGIGHGILQFLCDEAGIIKALRALQVPEVSFNYLGQFDPLFCNSTSLFRLIRESSEADRSTLNPRYHLLEIDGYISEGRLHFVWAFSNEIHRPSTIDRVANDFMDRLRSLITQCQTLDIGNITPSDFPLAQLSQRDLDTIAQLMDKTTARARRRVFGMTAEDGMR